jgi:ABC-type nitrate/sulfonate/bicarbonate transport system ATPase subunit
MVVMEGLPGRIAAEVINDLARPRNRGNASFNATREAVLAALGDARPAAARRSSEVTGIR